MAIWIDDTLTEQDRWLDLSFEDRILLIEDLLRWSTTGAVDPKHSDLIASGAVRRAPRRKSRRWIPQWLRSAIYHRDGFACVECGSTDDLTLDHIHPWSLGGPDTFENLRSLCRRCNSRKGARV